MTQPRRHSLVETCLNTATGFVLSWLLGKYLFYPLLGVTVSNSQNFWLVVAFTGLSVARGYLWRRIFNWYQWRKW